MFAAICAYAFLTWSAPSLDPPPAQTPATDKVHLAVVFREAKSSRRHLEGVKKVVARHALRERTLISEHPYYDDKEGFEVVRDLIQADPPPDVILGPTDSGAYAELTQRRLDLESHRTPVISSLATVEIPNLPDGYFFRTNGGLSRRVHAMFDFLRKHWVRRIAVLYVDSEFGRSAEEAFREEMSPGMRDAYLALPFEKVASARHELRTVLNAKPEALGVFATREDILGIHQSLGSMHDGFSPYTPLMFTIIDARALRADIPELYFVSMAGSNPKKETAEGEIVKFEDEVEALAFDTASMVLDELEPLMSELGDFPTRADFRQAFRDRFAKAINSGSAAFQPVTKMEFANFENQAMPGVYRLNGDVRAEDTTATVSFGDKLAMKLNLIWRGVGFFPVLILALLWVSVYLLNRYEISSRYPDNRKKIIRSFDFHIVVFVNFLIVALLYLFLAETGSIPYDSVLAALTLPLAAKTLMSSTIFETRAGRTIGLASFHDRLVKWLGERMMITAYKSAESNVNVVAYRNTLQGMKAELESVYANAKSLNQARELRDKLNRELAKETDILAKRKKCARMLLRTLSWPTLQERGFAPMDVSTRPKDPERLIKAAAEYCMEDPQRAQRLRDIGEAKLEEAGKSRRPHSANTAIKERFHNDMKEQANQEDLQMYLGALFLHFNYNEQQLIEDGFLEDPEWLIANCVVSAHIDWRKWTQLQQVWRRTLQRLNKTDRRRELKLVAFALTERDAIRRQIELLKRYLPFSRRRLVDLGATLSRNETFALSYQYCIDPVRRDQAHKKLAAVARAPENKPSFEAKPEYSALCAMLSKAAEDEESKRQRIKQILQFLIMQASYGPAALLRRGLFPDSEAIVRANAARLEQDAEARMRLNQFFYLELDAAGTEAKSFYKIRFSRGSGFWARRLIGWRFFLSRLNFTPRDGLKDSRIDRQRRILIYKTRFLARRCNFDPIKLQRFELEADAVSPPSTVPEEPQALLPAAPIP